MHEAELQRAQPTEAVAQAPRGQQQPGEHERVRVDDPLELLVLAPSSLTMRRDRDVEDRVVDDDDEQADAQDEQDQPAALVGVGRDVLTHPSEPRARSARAAAAIASSARRPRHVGRVHERQPHVGRRDPALCVQHAP